MNNSRRKKIASVIKSLRNITDYNLIGLIQNEIEDILWDEEDTYNNTPESLQYSMRGEESMEAIDNLQDAIDALEEAIDIIDEIDNTDDENEDEELNKNDIDGIINQAIDSLEQII